jgi:hypothetical protein
MAHTTTNASLIVGESSGLVKRLQTLSFALIAVGAIGLGITFATGGKTMFFPSYLLGFIFFTGITLTALFFSTLQFLVQAGWSAMIRRIPEMFTAFLPIVALGLIPIIADVWVSHSLYHWTHAEDVAKDHILTLKSPYLNPTFFTIRMVIYVALWLGIRAFIVGNSFKQDTANDIDPSKKNYKRSAPALIAIALTLTFAAFDLVMSLDPHWFSTMFGVYFFAGNFVTTIGLIALFAHALKQEGHLKGLTTEHFHDLGKFMFAFTVFWAYITFSQYFLIWFSNIPEETLFFMHRFDHGWQVYGYALVFLRFIGTFFILLKQDNKRNPNVLRFTAFWIVASQFIDLSFIILPNFHPVGSEEPFTPLQFLLPSLAGFAFFGGLFFYIFAQQLKTKQVVAANDPFIKESLELVS